MVDALVEWAEHHRRARRRGARCADADDRRGRRGRGRPGRAARRAGRRRQRQRAEGRADPQDLPSRTAGMHSAPNFGGPRVARTRNARDPSRHRRRVPRLRRRGARTGLQRGAEARPPRSHSGRGRARSNPGRLWTRVASSAPPAAGVVGAHGAGARDGPCGHDHRGGGAAHASPAGRSRNALMASQLDDVAERGEAVAVLTAFRGSIRSTAASATAWPPGPWGFAIDRLHANLARPVEAGGAGW